MYTQSAEDSLIDKVRGLEKELERAKEELCEHEQYCDDHHISDIGDYLYDYASDHGYVHEDTIEERIEHAFEYDASSYGYVKSTSIDTIVDELIDSFSNYVECTCDTCEYEVTSNLNELKGELC